MSEYGESETEEDYPDLAKTTVTRIRGLDKPKPRKKTGERKNMRPWVRAVLYIILFGALAAAGVSGYHLYVGTNAYRKSDASYEEIRKITADSETDAAEDDTAEPMPGVTVPDFASLAKINPDIAGWLSLEGTVIDYPVVQGSDNEYYLNHLFTGEVNRAGCVFMDKDNAKDFSDPCTFLYAHNMRNGTMFAELEKYREQSYYEAHPVLILQSAQGERWRVELFAGILTAGDGGYVQTAFESMEEYLKYCAEMKERSTFQSEVNVTAEDRILGMSTCRYDVSDGRYVLFGRLVSIN